jgi:hypothetical protein
MLICGNDADAKKTVTHLFDQFGWNALPSRSSALRSSGAFLVTTTTAERQSVGTYIYSAGAALKLPWVSPVFFSDLKRDVNDDASSRHTKCTCSSAAAVVV